MVKNRISLKRENIIRKIINEQLNMLEDQSIIDIEYSLNMTTYTIKK